jgi:hypothetical protein
MADHITLQVQQIHCRIFEKTIAVPRRRAEIPEVRNYEKKAPKQKEYCLRFYEGLKTGCQIALAWKKGKHQRGYAKEPSNRMP